MHDKKPRKQAWQFAVGSRPKFLYKHGAFKMVGLTEPSLIGSTRVAVVCNVEAILDGAIF